MLKWLNRTGLRSRDVIETNITQPNDAGMKSRAWTLNDEIQHHKHGFVPESNLQMSLSFQTRRGSEVIHVATLNLDLKDLLKQNLVYETVHQGKKGFRLRFVHDTSDHRIYIQRPRKDAARMFVAEVPTPR